MTRWRPAAAVSLLVAVLVAVLGAPLGLLSAALEPRVAFVLYLGPGNTTFASTRAESDRALPAGDFVLVLVLAGAGLLVGLLLLLLHRRLPPVPLVVGVLVGGCLAGLIAAGVAHVAVHGDYGVLTPGQALQARPYVRGRVDWVALPAVALLTYLVGNARWLLGGGLSGQAAANAGAVPPSQRAPR